MNVNMQQFPSAEAQVSVSVISSSLSHTRHIPTTATRAHTPTHTVINTSETPPQTTTTTATATATTTETTTTAHALSLPHRLHPLQQRRCTTATAAVANVFV